MADDERELYHIWKNTKCFYVLNKEECLKSVHICIKNKNVSEGHLITSQNNSKCCKTIARFRIDY